MLFRTYLYQSTPTMTYNYKINITECGAVTRVNHKIYVTGNSAYHMNESVSLSIK